MTSPPILAVLSSLGFIALIYTYLVLARLSQRLGNVTKTRPYYRLYYVSIALGVLALASDFFNLRLRFPMAGALPLEFDPQIFIWTFYVPLALSALIALAVTWRYWSWLLRAQN